MNEKIKVVRKECNCKDGAFDAAGFGDYAFQTLEAAKVISGMKGGTING